MSVRWRAEYPNAFDDEDLRLALSQNRYHFGEWCVAVHYAKLGYDVLVEKYLYKNHPRKLEIINGFFTPEQIDFLKYPKPRHQAPDLFVYKGKDFFFVEVKRDSDRLGKSQQTCFENIEKEFGCKVILVSIKTAKSLGDNCKDFKDLL